MEEKIAQHQICVQLLPRLPRGRQRLASERHGFPRRMSRARRLELRIVPTAALAPPRAEPRAEAHRKPADGPQSAGQQRHYQMPPMVRCVSHEFCLMLAAPAISSNPRVFHSVLECSLSPSRGLWLCGVPRNYVTTALPRRSLTNRRRCDCAARSARDPQGRRTRVCASPAHDGSRPS